MRRKSVPAPAWRRGLMTLGLAGLLLATPLAWSQDAAPAATAPLVPAAEYGPDQLQEVVVTATKRAQSLRDIPESITSISGDEMEKGNVQDTQDIAKLVPGVNYTTAGDSPPRVTVRGISSQPATGFTTGELFGDVSFADEYVPLVALDPNPFDLKSVDVMKGPQGTLFGASALNGAIRYVPELPRYGVWQGKYYVQYSKYIPSGGESGGGDPLFGGVLNMPLYRHDLALRLVGFERKQPGYLDNTRLGVADANHINQGGLRGILGWQPFDDFNASLTYAWQNTHTADKAVADNSAGQLTDSDSPRMSPNHQNYNLASLQLNYFLPWAQLVSETAYVHKGSYNFFDASSRLQGLAPSLLSNVPLLAQIYHSYSHTESQELRLVSLDDPDTAWKWVTGLVWSQQHVYDRLDIPVGNNGLALPELQSLLNALNPGLGSLFTGDGLPELATTDTLATVKETALFGDLTWRPWQQLELSAGGRLYRTTSEGSNTTGGVAILATKLTPASVTIGEVSAKDFNPKFSVLWHATSNLTPYATASKGFRVGGVQSGAALLPGSDVPAAFKSDTIWNYEAGTRTQWWHNTLHFDVSVFEERWKHPQYLQPDSSGLLAFISNVGGVQSRGGEAALQWLLPIKGLMVSASGAYADTVTTEPFTASSGTKVPVGADWPFAPRWQTATTVAYLVDIGAFNLNGSLTHSYLSKATNSLAQEAPVFNYQQWDGQLTLDNSLSPWLPEITLSLNNLLDARGVVNHVYSTSLPEKYNDVTYIPPRSINLRLTGHF
jgi:iron complex outermembrane recepter protein